jgi:hypothetical protein
MARIRSVKPDLRTSKLVATWPFEMRYFFVLLWGYLDDKGRGYDVPKTIAGDCFPHDEKITASKVDKWLDRMKLGRNGKEGPICRYEIDGIRYVHAVNWKEHQKPNRPTPSRLPQCPLHAQLTEYSSEPGSDGLTGSSVPGGGEKGRRGEEEEGRGEQPPSRCLQHLDHPNPPRCGQCADARRAREAWDASATDRVARQAEADRFAIRACQLCNGEGQRWHPDSKGNGTVGPCDHKPQPREESA